jgi:hypothetical protein
MLRDIRNRCEEPDWFNRRSLQLRTLHPLPKVTKRIKRLAYRITRILRVHPTIMMTQIPHQHSYSVVDKHTHSIRSPYIRNRMRKMYPLRRGDSRNLGVHQLHLISLHPTRLPELWVIRHARDSPFITFQPQAINIITERNRSKSRQSHTDLFRIRPIHFTRPWMQIIRQWFESVFQ